MLAMSKFDTLAAMLSCSKINLGRSSFIHRRLKDHWETA